MHSDTVYGVTLSEATMKDQDIVGETLASVLPQYNKIWFRVPHLLQLNLILMIPLLSSAVAGYDGTSPVPAPLECLLTEQDH